jgi:hypothetical protein
LRALRSFPTASSSHWRQSRGRSSGKQAIEI